MTIEAHTQQSELGGYVELFQLDCSVIGGSTYYFTSAVPKPNKGPIRFNSIDYMTLPIQATDFESRGDGSQARPKLAISNTGRVLMAAIISLGDIVGAKLTRLRTFETYLDDGATPDPTQVLMPDVYYIEQKTSQTHTQVVFQLCSALEKYGVRLPRRQVTRAGDSRYGAFPGVGRTRFR